MRVLIQRHTYKRQKLALDIPETTVMTIKILILRRMSVFYEILKCRDALG